ncbi:MAG TPA: hypothetical protein VN652_04370 [Geobacteraceae bacterium]|nr:hypothetical protein [Geobacteraceae bacterium]
MNNINSDIDRIRKTRKSILAKRSKQGLTSQAIKEIRRIVVINSSSRSGSSLLYALLAKLPGVISLTGEASPFYKLNLRLERFNPHESEKIPSALLEKVIDFEGLSEDFLSDIYLPEKAFKSEEIDKGNYVDDLMLRILLQWTDIDVHEDELREIIVKAFEIHAAANPVFNTENFYLDLLECLNHRWPQINPFYYDIGTDRTALRFPSVEIPSAPPVSRFTIEEPPFVLLHPAKRAGTGDLHLSTLLLKSTVDCYRMNLLEKLFPNAEIKVIHLVRNPAATINGIFDGWHHRGFFSHNLGSCFGSHPHVGELRIKGYSDLYPHGKNWWNFDLPAGWQEYADRELLEVCAFQWRSANAEILENLDSSRQSCCTVYFEEIIRSLESRKTEFARMLEFMGIPSEEAKTLKLESLPVVQSTLPPQLYRWKKRKDLIERLLDDSKIMEMSERLGYFKAGIDGWL